jgi:4-amino-4-deoxy-L-arabinose transferase-like glycosyltransferase
MRVPASSTQCRIAATRSVRLRGLLCTFGVFVWLALVYVAYFAVHKPLTVANLLGTGRAAWSLAVTGWFLLLALALGRRLSAGHGTSFQHDTMHVALGLGLTAVGLLATGLAGVWHVWLLAAAMGMLSLILYSDLQAILVELCRLALSTRRWIVAQAPQSAGRRLDRVLWILAGVTVALVATQALTPVTDWDGQVYHITALKHYLQAGRLVAFPGDAQLNYPALGEMLFLVPYMLGAESGVKLLSLAGALMTAWSVYAWGRSWLGPPLATLATVLFLGIPAVGVLATWAYTDLVMTFFITTGLFAIVSGRSWLELLQAGLIAGCGVAVKYTGWAFVPGLVLAAAVSGRHQRADERPARLRRAGLVITGIGIALLPWYIKNWLLLGNPVYPFFFGGAAWEAVRMQWYAEPGSGYGLDLLRLLALPWEMTVLGTQGSMRFDATVGPVFLSLLPLAAVAAARDRVLRSLMLFLAASFVVWAVGVAISGPLRQTRLLLPAFPALALLSAGGLRVCVRWARPDVSLARLLSTAAAIWIGFETIHLTLHWVAENPLAYVLGLESRAHYLTRHLGPYYDAARFLNVLPPDRTRVVMLWEPRSLYINVPVEPDTLIDRFRLDLYRYGSADGIAAAWRRAGVTHVLISSGGLDYLLRAGAGGFGPAELVELRRLLDIHLEQVYGTRQSWMETYGAAPAAPAGHGEYLTGDPLVLSEGAVRSGADLYPIYRLLPQPRGAA